MTRDPKLIAPRPARDVCVQSGLRVFHPGDRVATPAGERVVARLRPGDRVLTDESGGATILWMAMSRGTLSEPPCIRVLFEAGVVRKRTGSDLPLAGQVSRDTGKLSLALHRRPPSNRRLH